MRWIGSLLLGLVGTPLAAPAQLTPLPARSTPEVDRLLAKVEESYRLKDAGAFVALFTDDFTQIDVNRRVEVRGNDAWRAQTERVNAAHREMSRVHHGRVVVGNLVFVEIEWAGTVLGPAIGLAEDRRYRFGGFGVMELQGGRIRKQVLYIDYATYRELLGARAPPADTEPPGGQAGVGAGG